LQLYRFLTIVGSLHQSHFASLKGYGWCILQMYRIVTMVDSLYQSHFATLRVCDNGWCILQMYKIVTMVDSLHQSHFASLKGMWQWLMYLADVQDCDNCWFIIPIPFCNSMGMWQ
jgi:hypothetical protein